jgi:hypothetical protein
VSSRIEKTLAKAFRAVRADAGEVLRFRGGTVCAVVLRDLTDQPRQPGRPDFSVRALARLEFTPTDPLPTPGETLEDWGAGLRYRIQSVERRSPHSLRALCEVSPFTPNV